MYTYLLTWTGLIWRRFSYRKSLFKNIKEEFCCLSYLSSWRKKSNDEMFSLVQPVCACLLTFTLNTSWHSNFYPSCELSGSLYLQKHLKMLTCLWLDLVWGRVQCFCKKCMQINILFMFEQLSSSSINSLCFVAKENLYCWCGPTSHVCKLFPVLCQAQY